MEDLLDEFVKEIYTLSQNRLMGLSEKTINRLSYSALFYLYQSSVINIKDLTKYITNIGDGDKKHLADPYVLGMGNIRGEFLFLLPHTFYDLDDDILFHKESVCNVRNWYQYVNGIDYEKNTSHIRVSDSLKEMISPSFLISSEDGNDIHGLKNKILVYLSQITGYPKEYIAKENCYFLPISHQKSVNKITDERKEVLKHQYLKEFGNKIAVVKSDCLEIKEFLENEFFNKASSLRLSFDNYDYYFDTEPKFTLNSKILESKIFG